MTQIARVIATLLLTTRATVLLYYGGGDRPAHGDAPARGGGARPVGHPRWPHEKGRDGERTPMQWDTSKDAEFSTAATTWLPIAPDYTTVNVKTEEAEPDSLVNWNKKLIAMRRRDPTLRNGKQIMIDESNPSVLSYVREGSGGIQRS